MPPHCKEEGSTASGGVLGDRWCSWACGWAGDAFCCDGVCPPDAPPSVSNTVHCAPALPVALLVRGDTGCGVGGEPRPPVRTHARSRGSDATIRRNVEVGGSPRAVPMGTPAGPGPLAAPPALPNTAERGTHARASISRKALGAAAAAALPLHAWKRPTSESASAASATACTSATSASTRKRTYLGGAEPRPPSQAT